MLLFYSRPVYNLAECIANKISSYNNKWCESQRIVDALLNKEDVRQEFVSELRADMTDSGSGTSQQKWVDTISFYSQELCPSKSKLLFGLNRL